ncbi:MAG: MlaD family protein [Rhodospirillaceae bacterium]
MKPGPQMVDLNRKEVSVGAVTLILVLGTLSLLVSGAPESQTPQSTGLRLTAEFNRIDGLSVDSPIRMAGIDVGRVSQLKLGNDKQAMVSIEIFDPSLPIPSDTAAVIETDGIFGEKYIELHPGGELELLKSGQQVAYTQDSVVLETLLNQVVARAKTNRRKESGE